MCWRPEESCPACLKGSRITPPAPALSAVPAPSVIADASVAATLTRFMEWGSPPLSIATPVTGGDNYSGVPLASSSLLPGHVSKLLSAPDVVSELPKRSVSPLRNNAWLSPVVVREKIDTKASPSSREEPSAFETLASFLGRGFG
jgi:hypothetical protein